MPKADGRDGAGRFAAGNAGGPGRPSRATETEYLRVLSDACPPETWQRIVAKAVTDALDGDGAARAWLSRYLLGTFGTSRSVMGLDALLSHDERMGLMLGRL